MMQNGGHVYVLASRRNGTLYVGVTSDLVRRVTQHRAGEVSGFTARYDVHRLVYAEWYPTIAEAIVREKRLKRWRRAWKLDLIESRNPAWRDLYADLLSGGPGPLTDLFPDPPPSTPSSRPPRRDPGRTTAPARPGSPRSRG